MLEFNFFSLANTSKQNIGPQHITSCIAVLYETCEVYHELNKITYILKQVETSQFLQCPLQP